MTEVVTRPFGGSLFHLEGSVLHELLDRPVYQFLINPVYLTVMFKRASALVLTRDTS